MSLGDAAESASGSPAVPVPATGAAADVDVDDTVWLRALAHPIRLRILSLLTGAPLTAADVARELDLTHANASYHLRQLLAAGAILIDGEERIRGGLAKRYRYRPDPHRGRSDELARHDDQGQRLVYAAVATELERRAGRRRSGGTGYLADAEIWVDPETWTEVRRQVAEAMLRLHQAARPTRTPGTLHVNATAALFEMEH